MQRLRNLLVMIVALMFAMPLFAQKVPQGQAHEKTYQQALDLFHKEKYASAQYLFDQIVKQQPDVADAYYYGAVCSSKLDNDDAQYRMDEFLRRYPQSSRCQMARFYLGNFYYSRGNYAQALTYYKQLDANTVEFGSRSEFEFKQGYCYFVAGEYDKAKSFFSRQLTGKSKYRASSLYYYAHIQYMDGDYELALTNFKKLEKDRRFSRIVPSYVARIYYYLGREEELLQMAPDLLKQKDAFNKDEIRLMVGEIYFNRGEYAKALSYYRNVDVNAQAPIDPEDAKAGKKALACTPQDIYYQMGYCYYKLQVYDSAAQNLVHKSTCVDSVAQHALYILGDVYVKLNKKNEARSMFLQASQLKFDKQITEDALFNYAKLSCELNKNPYNESIRSFEEYLKTYPKTKHKTEIQEILTSLYLTTRNYKDALTLIEKIPDRNVALNQAYQRIVVNRGIEIFNSGNVEEASTYFKKAIKLNTIPKLTADALYLNGEALYRLGEYSAARKSMQRFFDNSYAKQSAYYPQALYTMGYLQMKNKNHLDAKDYFNQYLARASKTESHQTYDVYNRIGDCCYVGKKFEDAILYYNRTIKANDKDADYATYQKAMSYGALGKNSEKFTYLDEVFVKFKSSPLCSKALFEMANTYMICDNNEMAILYYNNFINEYPGSAYVKEALLNLGLVYYNTERGNQALEAFDRLLKNYPGTSEARDALSTVKNIYIDQNRADEYFAYVKETTHTTVSAMEQDSTVFMAVENRYQDGDCGNAIVGFQDYLKKFPKGLFGVKAHYYLADCLNRQGEGSKALPHYEAVVKTGKNQYTESSLLQAATIAYSTQDYAKASTFYAQLAKVSENASSRLQGLLGVMRCNVGQNQHNATIGAAKALIADAKVTAELRDEALLTAARSCYNGQLYDSALYYYAKIEKSTNGEYSGEAAFYKAEIYFLTNKVAAAEHAIDIAINESHSDYWLARTFILWADIFYAQGNSLQAKQTLQSIIDNYDGQDLVQMAIQKRNSIIEEESAQQQTEDSSEILIDINDGEEE